MDAPDAQHLVMPIASLIACQLLDPLHVDAQHLVMPVHGSNATIDAYLAPAYHLLNSPWRIGFAVALFVLAVYGLLRCWASEACAGVGPLIMLMPGAHVGAVLIVFVLLATVLLPFTSNMFEFVSPETNPAAFFLILPSLCFAVLFWGTNPEGP